jgi:hypothetical protein
VLLLQEKLQVHDSLSSGCGAAKDRVAISKIKNIGRMKAGYRLIPDRAVLPAAQPGDSITSKDARGYT